MRNPMNGWALLGKQQALAGLGRDAEALQAASARDEVWQRADQEPAASCYCASPSGAL